MRKTYAYNGITIGVLCGLAAGAVTESVVLGVIAAIVCSVIAFALIRLFENAVYTGVDKAASAISDHIQNKKNNDSDN